MESPRGEKVKEDQASPTVSKTASKLHSQRGKKVRTGVCVKMILKKQNVKLTSAHALGSTKRPIRPASLALRTFSNNGMMVEFELEKTLLRKSCNKIGEQQSI